MADMITRCPKCGTAFRISDALLKSAKGVVRCGSCLSVFNAKDHLEAKPAPASAPPRPTPPPAPKPAQPPPPPASAPVAPDSVEDESDNDDNEELASRTPWRVQASEDSLFERSQNSREEEEDLGDEDDEAWALELLKDDSDLNVRFKKVTEAPAKPTVTPAEPKPLPKSERRNTSPEIGRPAATADIAPPAPAKAQKAPVAVDPFHTAEPEVEEVELAPPPVAPRPARASLASSPAAEGSALAAANGPFAGSAPSGTIGASETVVKRKPIRPKLEPKSVPLEEVIAALEPEPLEVAWHEPGAWKKRLLWPAMALLALLCLLVQVAWLEFHRLNRIEPYRSVYSFACRYLGCQVPELLDRSQIQTSNLLVRSHPELTNALLVDVILQNNAPFEQTFPALRLTFTNLQNEPVATRTLNPGEYLGGELAGRDKMPVRQPVHIALEIADPGSEAVSYHISIIN